MSEAKRKASWLRGVFSSVDNDDAPTSAPVTVQALVDAVKMGQENVKASYARLHNDMEALNRAKAVLCDFVRASDLDINCEPEPMTMRTLVQIDEAQT